jgi:hypothetical protein
MTDQILPESTGAMTDPITRNRSAQWQIRSSEPIGADGRSERRNTDRRRWQIRSLESIGAATDRQTVGTR